jgi:LysR family transcriptional activator of nhaA
LVDQINYRHLHYFWVVAKEGGFARAAARLDMAVQTVSAQVRELERALGHQLLKPTGRCVVLTEAGEAAFARAGFVPMMSALQPDGRTRRTWRREPEVMTCHAMLPPKVS